MIIFSFETLRPRSLIQSEALAIRSLVVMVEGTGGSANMSSCQPRSEIHRPLVQYRLYEASNKLFLFMES